VLKKNMAVSGSLENADCPMDLGLPYLPNPLMVVSIVMGVPQNRWFISWKNPTINDDNWGYPCDLGNLHMISKISAFPPECSSLLPWRSLTS
jgi:hypothetical protein